MLSPPPHTIGGGRSGAAPQLSLHVTELDAALAQKSQAAGEQEKQLAARDQSIAKLKELVNDKVCACVRT